MEIERDNILQKVVAIIKEYDVKKIVLHIPGGLKLPGVTLIF